MGLDKQALRKILLVFRDELIDLTNRMTECLIVLSDDSVKNNTFNKTLDDFLRLMHTVKGSSRGVGLEKVSELAHKLEGAFSPLHDNPVVVPKSLIEVCYLFFDEMHLLVQNKLNDTPERIDIDDLFDKLSTAQAQIANAQKIQTLEEQPDKAPIDQQEKTTLSLTIDQLAHLSERANYIVTASLNMKSCEEQFKEFYEQLNDIMIKMQATENAIAKRNYQNCLADLADCQNDFLVLMEKLKSANVQHHDSLQRLSLGSHQLVDQLQEVRLVPVKELLIPLARTAREIAFHLNKKINFTIEGGGFEVDRLVLQKIKDPMIHLVRNAIDHGTESSAKRSEANKSEATNVSIEVKLENDRFILDVKDDGPGLDFQKIKAKLVHLELYSQSEVDQMDESMLVNTIFHPGFSTRDQATQISGRGYGLDLVRHQVALVQGGVSVASEQGKGTAISLDLPISLTANRGLVIESAGHEFIILSDSIGHILPFETDCLSSLQGQAVYFLNDASLPFYLLSDLLRLKLASSAQPGYAIVINQADKEFVLLVDDIKSETRVIIEPLLPPFSAVHGIIGGSLLRSDRLTLVLSAADLVS